MPEGTDTAGTAMGTDTVMAMATETKKTKNKYMRMTKKERTQDLQR